MNQFESVKAAVTLRQAAETYGLRVLRNGMTCCPFHKDRHPSLKMNEDYFFCFGCGASGDVIDFTARLFGISLKDAGKKLAEDFGILAETTQVFIRQNPPRLEELRCRRALTDYLHLLKKWKTQYAPNTPGDSLDDRFVESCQQYDRIAGLLEMLDEASSTQRSHTVSALTADGSVARIERRQDTVQKNPQSPENPIWFDGKNINEALFCQEFLREHRIIFTNRAFFTPDGRVTDDLPLRGEIYESLKSCAVNNIPKKISNILEVLKLEAQAEDLLPEPDRVHLSNGTLLLDGTFTEGKPEIVRNRLPVAYNPDAPQPVQWLRFLEELLYPEDIPTLQEFIGYCLIPSNAGQRMLILKGSGGEGKSQIGAMLGSLFGSNMKDGSIGKISENRFARADLEHTLLMVDDDMRMEALRQTNYVKSIVTAQGKMDLERKGKQSYQGWMYARLLAFSNGDRQALYDRSDGFYRRQLMLTTKPKPAGRTDDPYLGEKLKAEAEGIFLWAFAGLQRLALNNFRFTESERARENREAVKRDNNNIFSFLESDGYIQLKADFSISSKDLYSIYRMWCDENGLSPLKARSFSDAVVTHAGKYNLEHCNNVTNPAGRRVWGFMGIEAVARPDINSFCGNSLRTYVPDEWDK